MKINKYKLLFLFNISIVFYIYFLCFSIYYICKMISPERKVEEVEEKEPEL